MPPPGIQAQRPRTRTARTTRQIKMRDHHPVERTVFGRMSCLATQYVHSSAGATNLGASVCVARKLLPAFAQFHSYRFYKGQKCFYKHRFSKIGAVLVHVSQVLNGIICQFSRIGAVLVHVSQVLNVIICQFSRIGAVLVHVSHVLNVITCQS